MSHSDQTIIVEHSGYGPSYVISLDDYERANLLWLLAMIGYSNGDPPNLPVGIEPFTLCNNGDWVGQIANKLQSKRMHNTYNLRTVPNGLFDLQNRINEWIKTKIKEMSLTEIFKLKQPSGHDVGEAMLAVLPVEPLKK